MSNLAAQEYIAQLIAENSQLRERIKYLEANPPKRKQKLQRLQKEEKTARAKANYEKGGVWFHRSKAYKNMSKAQLTKYHKDFPDAPVGIEGQKIGIGRKS